MAKQTITLIVTADSFDPVTGPEVIRQAVEGLDLSDSDVMVEEVILEEVS